MATLARRSGAVRPASQFATVVASTPKSNETPFCVNPRSSRRFRR